MVECVRSVGGRGIEDVGMCARERERGVRVSERQARAVRIRGGDWTVSTELHVKYVV